MLKCWILRKGSWILGVGVTGQCLEGWNMQHVLPSFMHEKYLAGVKVQLEFLLLAVCLRNSSREWPSCACCSWDLIIIKWQKKGHQDDWELEHMLYVEKLRELVSFTLRRWRLWGTWKKSPGTYGEVIEKMDPGSSWQCMVWKWEPRDVNSNRGSTCLQGINFFPMRAVKKWNRLSKDILQPRLLWVFKTQLDTKLTILSDLKAKPDLS